MIRKASPALIAAALVTLVQFAACGPARGQTVRAYVNVDSISVGERIGLTMVANRDSEFEVTFPALPPDTVGRVLQLGDVLVLGMLDQGSRRLPDGSLSDSVIYDATTFALDTARVTSIPVLLSTPTDTVVAQTDPFLIPVRSAVPSDAQDIMDLAPIADFPAPVWPWVVFLLMLLTAIAIFIYWFRSPPKEVVLERERRHASLLPHEEAYARLAALEDFAIDADEAAEEFCVELSDIVRTYLWRRTAVHALEMATGELVSHLRGMELEGQCPDDVHDKVENVLQTCDLAKFAEIFPDEATCREKAVETDGLVGALEAFLAPEPELESEAETEAEAEAETDAEAGYEAERAESDSPASERDPQVDSEDAAPLPDPEETRKNS